ncbi:MAG: hypothetical protein HY056_17445 [Proteobacteria bacterium]|nr:hypothetical protein [Pseudomonadota bacterium]
MRFSIPITRVGWLLPLAVMQAQPARADAIDGNWCHNDGRRLTIRASEILTPGGSRIAGNYGRHDFSYVVPGNEPSAGQTVFMILLNEYTVHLHVGEQPSGSNPADEWKRCAADVS